jgi:hypothetical protein
MKITKENVHAVLNRIIYSSLIIITLFWAATLIEDRSVSNGMAFFGTFTVFVTLFGAGTIIMALVVKVIFYILPKV